MTKTTQQKATWELQAGIKALSSMTFFNTEEENARLAEYQNELRRRNREQKHQELQAKLRKAGVKGLHS